MFFVKHKNPNHPDIASGNEWATDGPFDSTLEASQHADRCAYAACKIKYEIYEVTPDEPKIDKKRKAASPVQPPND